MSDALIASLTAAVTARPDDVPLRLHLAGLLLDAGRQGEAVGQVAQALQQDPANADAQALMRRALGNSEMTAEKTSEKPTSDNDLSAYEKEFDDVVPPRFARAGADDEPEPVAGFADRMFDVERATIRLSDVGGMPEVKRRLELAFLGPLRNPQLRKLYGKNVGENAVHGSDSVENGALECGYFFQGMNLV